MSILELLDRANRKNEYVSASDSERELFHKHPWSIGGGGVAELKDQLDAICVERLGTVSETIGIMCFTLEDEAYLLPSHVAAKAGIESRYLKLVVEGEEVTDWSIYSSRVAIFPYDSKLAPLDSIENFAIGRFLWRYRTSLSNSLMFGNKTKVESGLNWFEYGRLTKSK